jgi:hypothetical protein
MNSCLYTSVFETPWGWHLAAETCRSFENLWTEAFVGECDWFPIWSFMKTHSTVSELSCAHRRHDLTGTHSCFLLQAKTTSPVMSLIYFSSCRLACDRVGDIFRPFWDARAVVSPIFTLRTVHRKQLQTCEVLENTESLTETSIDAGVFLLLFNI